MRDQAIKTGKRTQNYSQEYLILHETFKRRKGNKNLAKIVIFSFDKEIISRYNIYMVNRRNLPPPAVKMMSAKDIAKVLQISRGLVYKLVAAGKIPCVRVGRRWRFNPNAIRLWVDEESLKNLKTHSPPTGRHKK